MKRILLGLCIILTICLFTGCKKTDIEIIGSDTIEIGFEYEYKALYKGEEMPNEKVYWIINNDNVVLCNNVITPVAGGEVILTCLLRQDGSVYAQKTLKVVNAIVNSIDIYTKEESIKVGEQLIINYRIDPEDTDEKVKWTSSDESVLTVDDGIITGIGPGTATITAKCSSATDTLTFTVIKEITEIELNCNEYVTVNTMLNLQFNIDDPVITTDSTNVTLIENYLYGKSEGKATIHVTSKSKPNLVKDFDITVCLDIVNTLDATEEEIATVQRTLKELTLDQKIGQIFFVQINGSNFEVDENGEIYIRQGYYGSRNNVYLTTLLGTRKFSNLMISYQNSSGNNPVNSISNLIKGVQGITLNDSGVGALVAADASELSYYPVLNAGFANFKNNLIVGTANDSNSVIKYFDVLGNEIYNSGINTVFYSAYTESQYIDGIFSKNADKQIIYSSLAYNTLKKDKVILAPYYGSFIYNGQSIEENEKLIKSAIYDGVQCLSVYGANEFYTANNNQSIFEYIRSLGFKGVLIDVNTEYVNRWSEDYTGYYNALNNGADMVLATFNTGGRDVNSANNAVFKAYDYLKEQVEKGTLPESKLDEIVSRILLLKLRNGILTDGTYSSDTFLENNTSRDQATITNLFGKNTYYTTDNFNVLDKNTQIAVISSVYTTYQYNSRTGTQYNLTAKLFTNVKKLGLKGVTTCALDANYATKIEQINEGDQVVIGIFNESFAYNVTEVQTIQEWDNEQGKNVEVNREVEVTKYVSWKEIIDLAAKRSNNITIIIMTDPTFADMFTDYSYPIVFANYNFDEEFTTLFDILFNGGASGVSLYE